MQHSITEIFRISNANNNRTVLATRRYIETNGIFVITRSRESEGHLVWARPLNSHLNNNKPLKLLDLEGEKLVWLYGEKTWFDTEVELQAHRIEVSAQRAEMRLRNIAKKGLSDLVDNMTIEEVKVFMEKMGLW